MKISYVSDLHCEHGLRKNFTLPGGDVLLLAGDIVVINSLVRRGEAHKFFELMEHEFSKYKQVFMIPGNHEYYGGNIQTSFDNLLDRVEEYPFFNLHNDFSISLAKDWTLLMSSLWTDYNNSDSEAMAAAHWGMNDHQAIRNGDKAFTPDDAWVLNREHTTFLKECIDSTEPNEKFIIMTHHTPSMKSSHPKWGGEDNQINYAFHNTQLEDFIINNPVIKYWVHGHTHDSMDYMIGECRVLCNPHGYGNENPNFDCNKYFEIEVE